MDPTPYLLVLNVGLVFILLYVLDPNIIRFIDLLIQGTITNVYLRIYQGLFRIRIYIDQQSLRPGPVGRFLRDRQLKAIQRNPAYQEFFNQQVQSNPLPEGED